MNRLLPVVLAGIMFGLAACNKTQTPPPVAENPPAPCSIPLGWFEHPTPFFTDPNGGAPKRDCDFQLWSWSAFIFWTLPDASGQPKFLSLPTLDDLKAGRTQARQHRLQLHPRTVKPKDVEQFQQAGTNGLLVDQNGRAVYYSEHMDPVYFGFAQKYYGVAKYQQATPDTVFPLAATVFKASWRIVQPGEDTSNIFAIQADIELLVPNPKGGVMASGKTAPSQVALVGMHVVGVINEHPEFAWATFEHIGNAPDLPANLQPTSPDPVSAQNFTFYKGGTAAKDCNINAGTSITLTDPVKQTLSPVTNVFRQFAYGGGNAQTVSDIQALNIAFRAGLKPLNPVFTNYLLHGTAWLPSTSPLKPNDGTMNTEASGSPSLASATMETFIQGTNNNCFLCHNTASYTPKGQTQPLYPGKDINISHVILTPFFTPAK